MTNTTLDEMKQTIKNEIPYVDVKPFSHNIISLELRMISEKFGQDVANQTIKDLKLDTLAWQATKD